MSQPLQIALTTNLFLLLLYIIGYPHTYNAIRQIYDASRIPPLPPHTMTGGVVFPLSARKEIQAVTQFFAEQRPKTLFSFPIRPLYYAFTPHHATSIIGFEPQTTAQEIAKTLRELEQHKPDIVLLDINQMVALSHPLAPIADYITGHYQLVKILNKHNTLGFYLPLEHARKQQLLAYHLFADSHNYGSGSYFLAAALPEEESIDDVVLAIQQTGRHLYFKTQGTEQYHLKLRLRASPTDAKSCADVIIHTAQETQHTICADDGIVKIPFTGRAGQESEIVLKLRDSSAVTWINPLITTLTAADEND